MKASPISRPFAKSNYRKLVALAVFGSVVSDDPSASSSGVPYLQSDRWLFARQNRGHRNPGSQNPAALSTRNFDDEFSLGKEHSTQAQLEKPSASELWIRRVSGTRTLQIGPVGHPIPDKTRV